MAQLPTISKCNAPLMRVKIGKIGVGKIDVLQLVSECITGKKSQFQENSSFDVCDFT